MVMCLLCKSNSRSLQAPHFLASLRRKRARTARGRTVVRPRWPGEDATPSGSREDSDGALSSADEASQPWPGERLALQCAQARCKRSRSHHKQGMKRTAFSGRYFQGATSQVGDILEYEYAQTVFGVSRTSKVWDVACTGARSKRHASMLLPQSARQRSRLAGSSPGYHPESAGIKQEASEAYSPGTSSPAMRSTLL